VQALGVESTLLTLRIPSGKVVVEFAKDASYIDAYAVVGIFERIRTSKIEVF